MPDDSPQADDLLTEGWLRAMQLAWQLAYATRLDELRGERRKTFDSRGVHPFSMNVGMVYAYEELCPALALAGFDPITLRRDAEFEAHVAHERELVAARTEMLETMMRELHDAAMRGLIAQGLTPEQAEAVLADLDKEHPDG